MLRPLVVYRLERLSRSARRSCRPGGFGEPIPRVVSQHAEVFRDDRAVGCYHDEVRDTRHSERGRDFSAVGNHWVGVPVVCRVLGWCFSSLHPSIASAGVGCEDTDFGVIGERIVQNLHVGRGCPARRSEDRPEVYDGDVTAERLASDLVARGCDRDEVPGDPVRRGRAGAPNKGESDNPDGEGTEGGEDLHGSMLAAVSEGHNPLVRLREPSSWGVDADFSENQAGFDRGEGSSPAPLVTLGRGSYAAALPPARSIHAAQSSMSLAFVIGFVS